MLIRNTIDFPRVRRGHVCPVCKRGDKPAGLLAHWVCFNASDPADLEYDADRREGYLAREEECEAEYLAPGIRSITVYR